MKKVVLAMMTMGFLMSSGWVYAAHLKIKHWQTQGGSDVYFVSATSIPILDVRVIFAAGSSYDGNALGLANVTNNMLGQGTHTQSADQIATGFDKVGAQVSMDIDPDRAMITMRTLTENTYFRPALDNFEDTIAHAVFEPNAFKRVVSKAIAEIQVGQQSPDTVAMNVFIKLLYGDQPYAHPTTGDKLSVSRLTSQQAQDFYKKYYVAKNANIVMVGAISESQAKVIAEEIASKLPEGSAAPALPMMMTSAEGKEVHNDFPAQQTTVILGQLGINRENPDFYALTLGNYILGALPMTSLLFQNVRNKEGLAYYATSQFNLLHYKGPFVIQSKTRSEKTKQTIQILRQTVNDFVTQGPTEKQLQDAKKFVHGNFLVSLATNKDILNVVTNIAFYKRPLDYLDNYLKNINAVTRVQVKSAMLKALQPKQMLLVTVGKVNGD